MGFEPTAFCLGSRHSTTELHPLADHSSVLRAVVVRNTSRGAGWGASLAGLVEGATGQWFRGARPTRDYVR